MYLLLDNRIKVDILPSNFLVAFLFLFFVFFSDIFSKAQFNFLYFQH